MKTLKKIGLYFVVTFVFTILLVIGQQTLDIDTIKVSLPQFGPGLAALVMLRLFKKDQIRLTLTLRGVPPLKYVLALAIPLAVPALLFLLYDQLIAPITVPTIAGTTFVTMLGGILLGAFGEEVGWRGYAQNILDQRLNKVAAFLIVGVLWGVWHIGNFQHGLLYMLYFVLGTIGYSAVMSWLLQGTRHNVLLATLFHFAVNVGFFILQNAMTDIRLVALNGAVWLGAALLIGVRYRKRFRPAGSPAEKRRPELDPQRSGSTMPSA